MFPSVSPPLCGGEFRQAAQGGFVFLLEFPFTGPVAVEDFGEITGQTAGEEDVVVNPRAGGFQKGNSSGAGGGEGFDDGAEQMISGGGEIQAGEAGAALLDGRAVAGQVRIKSHGGLQGRAS